MKLARFRHAATDGWGVVDTDRQVISPVDGDLADWAPALTAGTGEPTITGDPCP
jgi:hypothetical protein